MKILLIILAMVLFFHAGREAESIIRDLENENREHDTEQ